MEHDPEMDETMKPNELEFNKDTFAEIKGEVQKQ